MKKTFLFIFSFLFLTSLMFGAVFMTELADPNNAAGARFVELYNNGSSAVDLSTGWQLQRATNGNTYWATAVNLTGTISAEGFYIVCANQTTFTSIFGFAADQSIGTGGPADSNGDDQIRLLSPGAVVEDMFGVLGEDGSGTNHEFEDGRAERKATVTTGNTTYTFAEWNIWNDTGGSGTINDPQDAPGDFDPGAWIGTGGPLITVTPSSLTGFSYVFGSGPSSEQSFTVEGSDLTADIIITTSTNYEISETSGSGYTSPITLTQSGGAVTSTTIYTRLKVGLSAGDYNEDITCSSTDADNKIVSCYGDVVAIESLPFTETFDSSSWPAGWTFTDFTIENSSSAGGSAYEVELAYYNATPGASNITTPPINTSGETELVLSWKQTVDYYEGGSGTDFIIRLDTSTDGSTFSNSWSQTVLVDETAIKQVTLDSGDGVGSGTLYLRWLFYQNNTNRLSYWYIDDVSFTSDAPTVISSVINTPSNPNSSQTVSVSADVTDTDGISSVELHWGTSSGSLGTTITMSNGGSGDTYTTTSDIPAQSDGTTVYYEIYAVDNNTNPTTSSEFSYFVSDAVAPSIGDLVITEICGDGAGGGSDDGFMEIYNTTSNTLSLTNVQARYYNSNPGNPTQTVNLSGTVDPGGYIIITQNETNFNATYAPITADFSGSTFYFNGGDDGVDIYDSTSDAEILDSFNDNGTGHSPWTWSDNNVFERTSTGDGALFGNWTEITTGIGTPGADNENPLPVTLSDFSAAIIMNEFVQISWTTQSESSINVWNLYRETDDSAGQILINSQPGTNTPEPNTYTFDDFEVEEDITYYYYLEVTEYDGSSNMWGPISAILEGSSTPELPITSMLESNYPNPFNPSTTIKCDIKEGEEGELTIYNSRGQAIESQILNAGEHIIEWDGTPYGSGVYLYKLETNSYTKTRKMIMIK